MTAITAITKITTPTMNRAVVPVTIVALGVSSELTVVGTVGLEVTLCIGVMVVVVVVVDFVEKTKIFTGLSMIFMRVLCSET